MSEIQIILEESDAKEYYVAKADGFTEMGELASKVQESGLLASRAFGRCWWDLRVSK
ncbi:MAG: hypothetical protein AAFX54_11450 [Pseudomonadota bacterium]